MRYFFFFCLCICPFFYFSCAESEPDISSVVYTIVYDYESAESPAAERLSVFVVPASDSARLKSMSVRNIDSDYVWSVDTPLIFSDKDSEYAGYSALMPKFQDGIYSGNYTVEYTDMAHRTARTDFSLEIPGAFSGNKNGGVTLSGLLDDFGNIAGFPKRFLALYTDAGELLYFGSESAGLQNDAGIAESYPGAEKKRICLMNNSSTAAVLLPFDTIQKNDSRTGTESGELVDTDD